MAYSEQNVLLVVKIKRGILYLIIKRGQTNFSIVFILANGEEKG